MFKRSQNWTLQGHCVVKRMIQLVYFICSSMMQHLPLESSLISYWQNLVLALFTDKVMWRKVNMVLRLLFNVPVWFFRSSQKKGVSKLHDIMKCLWSSVPTPSYQKIPLPLRPFVQRQRGPLSGQSICSPACQLVSHSNLPI